MPIRVSIVEDNEQLRGTLARMLNRSEGFQCVSQYGTAEAALEGLPKDKPEVVLMDINLPGLNGVECVRRLKQSVPAIASVMLTAYEDTENIFNALAAGATGYLLKRAPRTELLEALREVQRGGSPMTTHIARKVVQSFQKTGPAPPPGEDKTLGSCNSDRRVPLTALRDDDMRSVWRGNVFDALVAEFWCVDSREKPFPRAEENWGNG